MFADKSPFEIGSCCVVQAGLELKILLRARIMGVHHDTSLIFLSVQLYCIIQG
jgi:hypothetical protein